MNKHAKPVKKADEPETIRTMWASYYADPVRLAEFKEQIKAHTGLKSFDGKISIAFMKDNTAAIVYHDGDEPVAFVSVDWADICLRITYVQW